MVHLIIKRNQVFFISINRINYLKQIINFLSSVNKKKQREIYTFETHKSCHDNNKNVIKLKLNFQHIYLAYDSQIRFNFGP